MDPELKQRVLEALHSLEWHTSVDHEWAEKDHSVGEEIREETLSELNEVVGNIASLVDEVSNIPTTENMGVSPLGWAHTFNWIRTHEGEIFGNVETLTGEIIQKSEGFYPTHDPKIAEFYARGHVPKEEQSVG